jgi:hypothetical protein
MILSNQGILARTEPKTTQLELIRRLLPCLTTPLEPVDSMACDRLVAFASAECAVDFERI